MGLRFGHNNTLKEVEKCKLLKSTNRKKRKALIMLIKLLMKKQKRFWENA